jgi:hypothetical protein
VRFGGRYEDMQEATDAIRDVLYLYYELTDYNGIVGDHDTGTFSRGASWTALLTAATADLRSSSYSMRVLRLRCSRR